MKRKPEYPVTFVTPKYLPPGVLSTELYRKGFGYFCHRPKGTRDWLMMYTVSGTGIVEKAEQTFECKNGDLVLIAPGTKQEFYTAEESVWEKMWCHFTPGPNFHSWLSFSENIDGVLYLRLTGEINEQVQKAFERMLKYNRSISPMSEELAVNALEEIILLLARYQREQADAVLDPRIQEVVNYLTANFSQPIQLGELAQTVCLSPSRLTHLFKEQVGHSITEFLQMIRLKQAAKLLQTCSKPVQDICAEVGFNSTAFFSRKFLSFFGVSPGAYRKRSIGEDIKTSS
ncbi:arabinose operon transcriptional regulator AraC [Paenibacillus macerans]|uniref:arabinose operon transcriptional regulator AraC n=1 Tax=Paenibacillus macerans TaxID=44252 RepID=UPI003D3238CF